MRQRPGRRPRPRAPAAAPRSRLGRVDAGASGVDLPEPLPTSERGTAAPCAAAPHTFLCPPGRSRSAHLRRVPAPVATPRAESVRHTCYDVSARRRLVERGTNNFHRGPRSGGRRRQQAPQPGKRPDGSELVALACGERSYVRKDGMRAAPASTRRRTGTTGGVARPPTPSVQRDQHAVVALAHAAPHVAAEHRLAPDGRTG